MQLSVVVSTWCRKNLLSEVVRALAEQSIDRDCYEVIVVDSNSPDGSEMALLDLTRPYIGFNFKYIHANHNILSSKRNAGLKQARSKWVIFLDDDCVPEKDFLSKYLKITQTGSSNIVYCGEVRYPEEWIAKSNYYRYRDSRHFGSGRRPDLLQSNLDYKTMSAMNMALHKKTIEEKKVLFNEDFVGYGCEDHEFGWQLQKGGFLIRMCDARIYHHVTDNTIDAYYKEIFHLARDGMRVFKENCPQGARGLSSFMFLEPDYKSKGFFSVIRLLKLSAVDSPMTSLLRKLLRCTDPYPMFYYPYLYKIVAARAYRDGVKARPLNRLSLEDVKLGWYR